MKTLYEENHKTQWQQAHWIFYNFHQTVFLIQNTTAAEYSQIKWIKGEERGEFYYKKLYLNINI